MPSRNPRWESVRYRQLWRSVWENCGGSLYTGADDTAEALAIREQCEDLGLPMGYGREHHAPAQLDDIQARAQFRRAR